MRLNVRMMNENMKIVEVEAKKAFTLFEEDFFYYKNSYSKFMIVHKKTGLGITANTKLKNAKKRAHDLIYANTQTKTEWNQFLKEFQKENKLDDLYIN